MWNGYNDNEKSLKEVMTCDWKERRREVTGDILSVCPVVALYRTYCACVGGNWWEGGVVPQSHVLPNSDH